ncbi:hypothetical protein GO613_16965 [Azoarcus communis]|uniref:dimethylamine monooxygenase subunit DmmA family protein n=1 Tax=Parazoarcus communis TaxID=41977 RepID=UPI001459E272|nr:dimethylamine monooxygenase subunit DmmA family protein [Parazoarcus communis]NMG49793.1 hypothetical protein [Parazoarcus communis]
MMQSQIVSRPRYRDLAAEDTAGAHLLIVEGDTLAAGQMAALATAFAVVAARLQTWLVSAPATALAPGRVRRLHTVEEARTALEHIEDGFGIADRLYLQGTEPFMWSLATAAGRAGLSPTQIRMQHAGSLKRRVWCTHCHQTTENVTTNIATCAGCARALLVRDHFSRRLGAFMGVMVDAEVPGEVPQREEVFR